MYCPECGTALEVGSYKCTSCEWTWEDTDVEVFCEEVTFDHIDDIKSADESKKESRHSSKRGIIIALVVLFIVIAGTVACILYCNTDAYKIKHATQLIATNDIDDGLELIEDIQSPQAEEMRAFAEVVEAKIDFQAAVLFYYMGEEYDKQDAYNRLEEIFNNFTSEYSGEYLEGELKELFKRYKAAFEFAHQYTDESSEMVIALISVQMVKFNDVDMNSGDWFTLNDLQNRIDKSSSAIDVLSKYKGSQIPVDDHDVISYCSRIEESTEGEYFIRLQSDYVGNLISECEKIIEKSQTFIFENSVKYENYDKIRVSQPNSDCLTDEEVYEEIMGNVVDIINNMRIGILNVLL